jgi:hypothetical protein
MVLVFDHVDRVLDVSCPLLRWFVFLWLAVRPHEVPFSCKIQRFLIPVGGCGKTDWSSTDRKSDMQTPRQDFAMSSSKLGSSFLLRSHHADDARKQGDVDDATVVDPIIERNRR